MCDPEANKVSCHNEGKTRKIQNDFENYLEKIRSNTRYTSSIVNEGQPGRVHGDFCDFREITPGQQIIFVIDKFQIVRNMQFVANGLFGFVLALNISLAVFMSVVLKYMLIWNFGNLMQEQTNLRNQQTIEIFNSTNLTFSTSSVKGSLGYWITSSSSEWTLFAVLDVCFSVRLCVLVICLGNVHFTSINFNSRLSQALLQAQKIADLIDMQGMGNKYFQGRQVMTPNEANTALAFITENSGNPMAFSAAGLFCFSRNLIMVIFSIITTYLVFLLQV